MRRAAALHSVVESFEPEPHHFARRSFLTEAQRTRLDRLGSDGTLFIRSRTPVGSSGKLQVALVERDGTAWGAVIELSDAWQDHALPVSDLRRKPLALLPRPYPQFLPSPLRVLFDPTITRRGSLPCLFHKGVILTSHRT